MNAILSTIVTLGENDYHDPTGKAVRHYVLTPNDKNGKDIKDRSNVHPHQLEVLKRYEDEKAAEELGDNKTNESTRVIRITENNILQMVCECVKRILNN